MVEEREGEKVFFTFFVSAGAALMMGAIIVATLFVSTPSQGSERTAISSLTHLQHHTFSIR